MSITIEEINKHYIKPLKVKIDPRPVKAADIFPDLYGNMFLVAQTDGGKSTVIRNIVPKMIGKKTKVKIFASTAYDDDVWISLRKYLENRDIDVEVFTSIKDDHGRSVLQGIVEDLTEEAIQREETKQAEEEPSPTPEELLQELAKQHGVAKYLDAPEDNPKEKKEKHRTPEYLFIFDDLSRELRSPELAILLKRNRQFHIRCIISSQYAKDLTPEAKMQIKGWMIFKNVSEEVLRNIHEQISLRLPFEVLWDLYKASTADTAQSKHNFFYFLPRKNDFRKNLTHRWKIPESIYNV